MFRFSGSLVVRLLESDSADVLFRTVPDHTNLKEL